MTPCSRPTGFRVPPQPPGFCVPAPSASRRHHQDSACQAFHEVLSVVATTGILHPCVILRVPEAAITSVLQGAVTSVVQSSVASVKALDAIATIGYQRSTACTARILRSRFLSRSAFCPTFRLMPSLQQHQDSAVRRHGRDCLFHRRRRDPANLLLGYHVPSCPSGCMYGRHHQVSTHHLRSGFGSRSVACRQPELPLPVSRYSVSLIHHCTIFPGSVSNVCKGSSGNAEKPGSPFFRSERPADSDSLPLNQRSHWPLCRE